MRIIDGQGRDHLAVIFSRAGLDADARFLRNQRPKPAATGQPRAPINAIAVARILDVEGQEVNEPAAPRGGQ